MKPLLRIALAAALLLPAACGQVVDLEPGAKALLTEVLSHVKAANEAVAHHGVRRVEFHWETELGPHNFAYRERVSADGTGAFDIETTELITPTPIPPASFALLQDQRAGFYRRYRDVAFRDLDLLLQNFLVLHVGDGLAVAGRETLHIALQRVVGEALRHDVAVDRETGLILASRTSGADGKLLSLMEFESIALSIPPAFDPHVQHNQEQVASPGAELDALLGFAANLPGLLPEGYLLSETSKVVDPEGVPWLKATYTDGVDVAFYLARPIPPRPSSLNTPGASAILGGSSVAVGGSFQDQPVFAEPRLRAMRVAGLQVLEGQLEDRHVIALGRVPLDDLRWMVESVFPR